MVTGQHQQIGQRLPECWSTIASMLTHSPSSVTSTMRRGGWIVIAVGMRDPPMRQRTRSRLAS